MRQLSPFRRLSTIAGLFGLMLMLVASVEAGTFQYDAHDVFHQDIANRSEFNAVGKIAMRFPGVGFSRCSGTAIGKRWVLTAAHCVAGADKVSFLLNRRKYTAKKWYTHKAYDRTVIGNGHDITLLRVDKAIPRGKRAKLAPRRSDPIGDKVTMVGYGTGGTGLTGNVLPYGTKRAGYNIIDSYLPSSPGKRILRWDFDADPELFGTIPTGPEDYPVTLEFSSAAGDSGGPLFDKNNRIIGITSFGGVGSFFFSTSGDTNIALHRNWIRKVMRLVNLGNTAKLATIAKTGSLTSILPDLKAFTQLDPMTGQIVMPLMYRDSPEWQAAVRLAAASAIPEPATALLLTGGSLVLLLRRRRAV